MPPKALVRIFVALSVELGPTFVAAAVADGEGRHAWTLEHFGNEVTVLRWRSDEDGADILLSCAGQDRRLRLRLSDKLAERLRTAEHGSVLIRPVEGQAAQRTFAAARYRITGGHVLTVSESSRDATGAVVAIGRILALQPSSLDVLIHPGHDRVTLDRVVGYRFALPAGKQEPLTFRDFVDSCSRRGSNDTNHEK